MDTRFLMALSEVPSVATACGPVVGLVREWIGDRANSELCQDSHLLVTLPGASVADLRCLFISHMDEIGGCALGRRHDGAFGTRHWGCPFERYAGARLHF
ncbi:MAG: hypothetical protein FJX72_15850, partial [Armatimonadetes bacterium]|nr:hypothetical protein [Armatimonadota bacterium]